MSPPPLRLRHEVLPDIYDVIRYAVRVDGWRVLSVAVPGHEGRHASTALSDVAVLHRDNLKKEDIEFKDENNVEVDMWWSSSNSLYWNTSICYYNWFYGTGDDP